MQHKLQYQFMSSLSSLYYYNNRQLYWNNYGDIERISMDGNNRTAIIDVIWYHNAILSFTLDYQAQVLYWVYGNDSNGSLMLKRSNIDGTNQQTILQLQNVYYDYYYYYRYYYRFYSDASGLSTVYNETLFLSLTLTRELYKLGINGDALLLINSSVLCRFQNSQLKMTNQPSGEFQGGLYFLDYTHMHMYGCIILLLLLCSPKSLWYHKWRMQSLVSVECCGSKRLLL